MENKMIRWFKRLFVTVCLAFIVCFSVQLYVLLTDWTEWIPWYSFLFVLLTPFIGYFMISYGAYLDSKKNKIE